MGDFFFRGFSHSENIDIKVQGNAGKRVSGINRYIITWL